MKSAREFRKAYGIQNSLEQVNLQLNLIGEEFKEWLQAHQEMNLMMPLTRAECLKELADLTYVIYQYAANYDWDLDEAMDRVHESNMSKLVDGKPIKREDGKVLKGPNYQSPNLTDLV